MRVLGRQVARWCAWGSRPRRTPAAQFDVHMSTSVDRVLSIQSHVVHGYVGNKCATFPLQLLGFDVDPINCVQFSNHKGYPVCTGSVLEGHQLEELLAGLEANNMLTYSHMLTGFMGSPSFLKAVLGVYRRLKNVNPSLFYICDPVLGDAGHLYVPKENVKIYREEILPLATIITPNHFECELLSGITIKSEADARRACVLLHQKGPEVVVITSGDLETGSDDIVLLASKRRHSSLPTDETTDEAPHLGYDMYRLTFPRLPATFTGTGDLITALLLAWTHRLPQNFAGALENIAATMQATLQRTHADGSKELRLIQSKADIEHPKPSLRACPVFEKVQGVIFDMDGTLTLPGQLDFAKIRAELGIDEATDIVGHIETQPPEKQPALLAAVVSHELSVFETLKLQPGLQTLMEFLESKGVKVAIATANCEAAVVQFVKIAGLRHDTFHPVITREYHSRKPDKAVAESVCAAWGLPPSAVLMIGDSLEDMQCGHAAGCQTCLVSAAHNSDVWQSGYASMQVTSLGQLAVCWDNIGR